MCCLVKLFIHYFIILNQMNLFKKMLMSILIIKTKFFVIIFIIFEFITVIIKLIYQNWTAIMIRIFWFYFISCHYKYKEIQYDYFLIQFNHLFLLIYATLHQKKPFLFTQINLMRKFIFNYSHLKSDYHLKIMNLVFD